ncbi:hypothetical protein GC197_05605 [bacterium]|nr:hypothetical protein [bacterium]
MRAVPSLSLILLLITCAAQAQETDLAPGKITALPDEDAISEWSRIEKLQYKLADAKAVFDFHNTPLDIAIEHLANVAGIPFRIDERALEGIGLRKCLPITFEMGELELEQGLRLMLYERDLIAIVQANEVLVTTPGEAESILVTRYYPLEDLVPDDDFVNFIDMLTTTIEPDAWDELGGPGTLGPFNKGLIISQTQPIHLRIQSLLTALRQVHNMPHDAYDTSPRQCFKRPGRLDKLRKHLDETRISVDMEKVPLAEAMNILSDLGKITIAIRERDLEEIGHNNQSPVWVDLQDVRLAHALDVLTDSLDLAWKLDGDLVIITTESNSETELETWVYPIHDLLPNQLGSEIPDLREELKLLAAETMSEKTTNHFEQRLKSLPDRVALLENITTNVEPDSWEELGGPGTVALPPKVDCLVVSQLGSVHDKIRSLLNELRAKQQLTDEKKLKAEIDQARAEVIIVQYRSPKNKQDLPELDKEDLAMIARRLELLVEPESWKQADHFIEVTSIGLSIRHRRDVQRKIEHVLEEFSLTRASLKKEVLNQFREVRPLFQHGFGGGGFF